MDIKDLIMKQYFRSCLSLSAIALLVGCTQSKKDAVKEVVQSGEYWIASRAIEFTASPFSGELKEQNYGYEKIANDLCQYRGQGPAVEYKTDKISKDVKDLRYVYIETSNDFATADKYFLSEFQSQDGVDFIGDESTVVFSSVTCNNIESRKAL